ncbi:MAG TPA: hypothetical protein IAB59_04210 [Candidatus Onthousia faecipullorum]|uniref:SpaA-like prealbumin fold domain-containing protein n=1 Tax=Candidatus Onthousia faecipullorum TaxID=2840887 RepID=A0A9D1GAW6_9FIRM|nr:hypothetical protein [Candidatus Onthousia faecipullorum]
MSSKISSRTKVKKTKANRNEAKFDKAMSDIKKIGIISCCLVGIMIIASLFVNPNESYAAVVETLPETFESVMEPEDASGGQGTFANYISYGDTFVTTPRAFYGMVDTDGNSTYETRLANIYCMDRRLLMEGGVVYKKDQSVIDPDLAVKYPGLIYIIENGDTLPPNILNIVSSDEQQTLIYYINQLIVWWYIDIVNGYSTGPDDAGRDEEYSGPAAHPYVNNLSVAEKTAIINDTKYGPYIKQMLTNAMNYVPGTTNPSLNDVDTSTITYNITDEYIETSAITITSNASTNFINYIVRTNNQNIKVLNENGVEQTTFSPNERFKLRIPMSEVKDYKINVQVTISGNFTVHNAYFYTAQSNPSNYQRALLGQIINETVADEIPLEFEIPTGRVIISKQNSETGERISGAVLSITDKTGKEVYRYETTGEDVDLTLPVGTYTITETIIPEGYNVEVTTTTFEITEGETTEVVIKNTPTINVPNTSISSNIIYIIGTSIIIVGIILIVVAKRPNDEKRK